MKTKTLNEIFSKSGNVDKVITADPKANGETKKQLLKLALKHHVITQITD